MSKKYKLAEYIEGVRAEGAVEIETEDGTVFVIDPPELWSEEQGKAAIAGSNLGLAQALLGDRYDEFVEKGGSAILLMGIMSEAHGISLGE